MNGRIAKKIRRHSQRAWVEYFQAIRQWPFTTRLHFCWDVLFSPRWKAKKPSKDKVLRERRPVPSH